MVVIQFGSAEEARILEEYLILNQDDSSCLRFLRARNHDLDKAEEILRKSMEWRAKNDIDNCENWPISEEVQKEFAYGCVGYDKKGQAVTYSTPGKWRIKEFIEDGYKTEVDRYQLHQLENVMRIRRESGRDLVYSIIDLEGLRYQTCTHYGTIQSGLQLFRDFEANYPEILDKVVIINAPWVFSSIFALVKPILSGSTLSKITVYNSDKIKWRKALLEDMPEESLPKNWSPELL